MVGGVEAVVGDAVQEVCGLGGGPGRDVLPDPGSLPLADLVVGLQHGVRAPGGWEFDVASGVVADESFAYGGVGCGSDGGVDAFECGRCDPAQWP